MTREDMIKVYQSVFPGEKYMLNFWNLFRIYKVS
jgi:hypothetical protein